LRFANNYSFTVVAPSEPRASANGFLVSATRDERPKLASAPTEGLLGRRLTPMNADKNKAQFLSAFIGVYRRPMPFGFCLLVTMTPALNTRIKHYGYVLSKRY
jgi:hypothetical protein